MRRRLILCFAAYLCLANFVWFGLGSMNLPKLRRLTAEGVSVIGTVSFTDCGNHSSVQYWFEANGLVFGGKGIPGFDNPSCKQFQVGYRLSVWYVPADPEINTPGDPSYMLKNELISVGLAATMLPAVLVCMVNLRNWH